jgi:hypothetical protein
MQRDDDEIMVRASAGGRPLGSVLFVDYDGELMPQDLEVDERYRGQGIAAAMYDYVKSLGYKIRRSGQQTDAGAGFWAKHRPDSNVWEQGVTDGSVTKKPQPYNDPNWAKKLPKEKLNALAGPRYKKDKKEQDVAEGLDPYRLERLDPQTRRVLTRMGDHKEPGSWLSASEAYAMSLGLQYKNRDPRGWEREVQHYVDLYRQYSGQGVAEGKIKLSTDPNWYGAEVGDYKASGSIVNIPANRLVGFEPDDKMNQPASKANVEKIVAGLKQGAKLPPLLVRQYKNGYQVLDGHHRFWAYKLLGVKSIPAQVVPAEDIEEITKQGVQEVKILSKVKGKGSEPGQLPRFGRPIAPGEETRYLGTKVADWQGREIWRDYLGGQLSYHLFDPDTRTVIVTTFGSRYKNNPRSYIIHGLYAAPGNPVRAAEFYRALVRDLGLTLISDRKQSPGGNKVWQQLEQFPDVEVYGYDTNTDQALNFGAGDVEMYTVPSAAVAGSKEMQRVARDLRLVATAR